MHHPTPLSRAEDLSRKCLFGTIACTCFIDSVLITLACYSSWAAGACAIVVALLHVAFCWMIRKPFQRGMVWYLTSVVSWESRVISWWAKTTISEDDLWTKSYI